MVLRGNKGGISRGQQSINGRLKKIDCQLIANKECYGSFTESESENRQIFHFYRDTTSPHPTPTTAINYDRFQSCVGKKS